MESGRPFSRSPLAPVFLWGLLVTVMTGSIASVLWHPFLFSSAPTTPLPIYGEIPSFILTDEEGHPFGSAELNGKVWIADFIFTSCAGTCPMMTSKMQILQAELPPQIPLVSITVDPKRDTPSLLANYARLHGANQGRWHFLTGEPSFIEHLVKEGFTLSFAEGNDPKEPITHSVRLVLVDKAGRIRGYYDATDSKTIQRLTRDARSLQEAP